MGEIDGGSRDLDLDFRPASYFVRRDVTSAIVQRIKGDRWRAMVRGALREGREVDPDLWQEGAPRGLQGRLERLDPRWMRGEYLPDYEAGEVEIARIVLASGTLDVYSVRARWVGGELRYRVVDEYGQTGT